MLATDKANIAVDSVELVVLIVLVKGAISSSDTMESSCVSIAALERNEDDQTLPTPSPFTNT